MHVTNEEIADILLRTAAYLEIEQSSPFRIRAYRNAADTIQFFEPPLAAMVEKEEDLTKVEDIGAGIAKKIEEICRIGHAAYVEQMEKETSPGLFELLRIPGLGATKVRVLRDAGIGSPEELLRAAESGKLSQVSGFGEATVAKLIERLRKRLGDEGASI